MADRLDIFQVSAQVEYVPYPPGTFIYEGTIPVTATPSCAHNIEFIKTGTAPVTVTPSADYYYQGPTEFVYLGTIVVTVTPQAHVARAWSYTGTIPCVVTPSCEVVIPVHVFEGLVGIEVLPCATYMVPIAGWDKYTGYGMVDLSFLSEDPPFWSLVGNIVLTINPAAASISGAGEIDIPISEIAFVIGGEGVWGESFPQADEIGVAEGGFKFGGAGAWASSVPGLKEIVATGGFKFGGAGVFKASDPAAIPVNAIIGSGGFIFGGTGLLPAATPPITAIIGSGGFKFGGFRPDPLEVTYPGSVDRIIEATVTFEMGREGVWGFSTPPATVIVSEGALFRISVGGKTSTSSPPLVVISGDGGFVMGGTGQEAPGFDTWVLTGNGFEPSLYSNFDFNAFAQFRGQFFGAKEDGIYLLSGPDDDGEEIHPGVRIGPTNLGTANQKRLRTVSIGEQSNGAKVRVQAGGRAGVANVVRGHAFIPRNLQAGVMTIDITDFDEVSHVEIIPLVLSW